MPEDRTPPTYFGAPPRAFGTGVSVVRRLAARTRMLAGFAVRTTREWTQAVRVVVRLQVEQRKLERRRKALQYELGGAALEEDDRRVLELRDELRACADEIQQRKTEAQTAFRRARRRTSEERSAVARTEIRPPA